jgi:hypothetical protein
MARRLIPQNLTGAARLEIRRSEGARGWIGATDTGSATKLQSVRERWKKEQRRDFERRREKREEESRRRAG